MFRHWELIIGVLTIILMVFIEIKSQKMAVGEKISWIKENFHLIFTIILFGLAITFTPTILLTKTYANSDTEIPVPFVLKLLQFFTWEDVHLFLDNNFLAIFCIFAIPMLFFKEKGLLKSVQIAILTISLAYFAPVMIENYWFFIHDLIGFRDFWDLYTNGAPGWFFGRIISGVMLLAVFFIFRAQLPEKERLFNFQLFKRKLDNLKSRYKNL
ncbi:MAG: hypothetical protein ACFFCD_01855 [Promethearchaeota archaeon]